jgi:NTP pyrophosphatase (non-canonical NTP hydrolase)
MPNSEAIYRLERDRDTLLHNASLEEAPTNKEGLLACAARLQDTISYLKVANLGGLSALVSLVRQWGTDRNIIGPEAKATVQTQFGKLMEEVGEIADGISDNDQHEIVDGIGDATVVLILLAELAGVRFETCLQAAWDEIKDRKGSMQNGHFVKSI